MMMTGKELAALHAPKSILIRGYLAREDDTHQWLDDGTALWVVSKNDIVGASTWTGGDPRFSGKPVVLSVRDGAEIQQIRRYRVDLALAPLTVARDGVAEIEARGGLKGIGFVRELQERWSTHVGISPQRYPKEHTTWSDAGGGDIPLQGPDDCG